MTMMEYFMMKFQEMLAEMESILGEIVIVEMDGSKTDLYHFSQTLNNPFFKSVIAEQDKITIEFHTADELTDSVSALDTYNRDEKYYMEKPIKEGTIIDEEQSVRWNREEVTRRNEEIQKRIKNNRHYHNLFDKAIADVIKACANSWYMTEFNSKTIDIIYAQAWEDGHSYGYTEVYIYFRDYMDMFVDACKAQGFI